MSCGAGLGSNQQPSACEMGWAAWDYHFCWSRRFTMGEFGVLEHPVQKFGPILACRFDLEATAHRR
jgi:hypothetical protein